MKMHDKQEQGNATPGQLFQTLTTGTETVRFHGIPFSVTRQPDGAVATLPLTCGNPSGWDNAHTGHLCGAVLPGHGHAGGGLLRMVGPLRTGA